MFLAILVLAVRDSGHSDLLPNSYGSISSHDDDDNVETTAVETDSGGNGVGRNTNVLASPQSIFEPGSTRVVETASTGAPWVNQFATEIFCYSVVSEGYLIFNPVGDIVTVQRSYLHKYAVDTLIFLKNKSAWTML